MPATQISPAFHIGQAVNFKSFTNHKGDRVDGAEGLTVVESEHVEGHSIPDWYRIKAVRPEGRGYFCAAERFFEPSTAVPANLNEIFSLAGTHGLLIGPSRP